MKFPILFTLLLLPAAATFTQSSFYPLGSGDYWIYWVYGQYGGGVYDTVTTVVEGDTNLDGKVYKIRHQWLSRYQTDYLLSPERVDSSGTVFRWNSKMGRETLAYRFGDTSQTGWFSEGSWLRFDSCAVEELFGRARRVLYLGEYSTVDTTLLAQRLFIDSIGYYTTIFYGIIDGTSPPVLHEARINGVFYGTEVEVTPEQDFYPLDVGNRWSYRLFQIDWVTPVDSSSRELRVTSDTVMANGKVYHQLNQPDVLGARFIREDSNYVYYYSPYDTVEVPIYNLKGEPGTRDTVRMGPLGSSTIVSVSEQTILGKPTTVREYSLDGLVQYRVTLARGLGVIDAWNLGDGGYPYSLEWTLRGAVIRDTLYGIMVGVKEGTARPSEYSLDQNFPNPFNPSTTIRYTVPVRSHLTLIVFDMLGQKVRTLVDGVVEAGYHDVQFNAGNLASGVYFYRLHGGTFAQVKKLCLIR